MATYFEDSDLTKWNTGLFSGIDMTEFNQHDKVQPELDQELTVRFEGYDLSSLDVSPLKTAAIYLNLTFVCEENIKSEGDGYHATRNMYRKKYEQALARGLNQIEDTLASRGGRLVR